MLLSLGGDIVKGWGNQHSASACAFGCSGRG